MSSSSSRRSLYSSLRCSENPTSRYPISASLRNYPDRPPIYTEFRTEADWAGNEADSGNSVTQSSNAVPPPPSYSELPPTGNHDTSSQPATKIDYPADEERQRGDAPPRTCSNSKQSPWLSRYTLSGLHKKTGHSAGGKEGLSSTAPSSSSRESHWTASRPPTMMSYPADHYAKGSNADHSSCLKRCEWGPYNKSCRRPMETNPTPKSRFSSNLQYLTEGPAQPTLGPKNEIHESGDSGENWLDLAIECEAEREMAEIRSLIANHRKTRGIL